MSEDGSESEAAAATIQQKTFFKREQVMDTDKVI